MRRFALVIVGVLWLSAGRLSIAQSTDLSGRWVREGSLGPAMNDVAPAWEDIAIQDGLVTIRRAPTDATSDDALQADLTTVTPEVYLGDGIERSSSRAGTARVCRSGWEAAQFVIECRQTDGGPGGGAPPVFTREVRFIDAQGRLVLELTWRSDVRVVTRSMAFRREQP